MNDIRRVITMKTRTCGIAETDINGLKEAMV